MEQGEINGKPF